MCFDYLTELRSKPLRDYDNPGRFNVVLPRDLRIVVAQLVRFWNAEEHVRGDARPRINRSHVIRVALEAMLADPGVHAYLETAWGSAVDESQSDAEAEKALANELGLPLPSRRRRRRRARARARV